MFVIISHAMYNCLIAYFVLIHQYIPQQTTQIKKSQWVEPVTRHAISKQSSTNYP